MLANALRALKRGISRSEVEKFIHEDSWHEGALRNVKSWVVSSLNSVARLNDREAEPA